MCSRRSMLLWFFVWNEIFASRLDLYRGPLRNSSSKGNGRHTREKKYYNLYYLQINVIPPTFLKRSQLRDYTSVWTKKYTKGKSLRNLVNLLKKFYCFSRKHIEIFFLKKSRESYLPLGNIHIIVKYGISNRTPNSGISLGPRLPAEHWDPLLERLVLVMGRILVSRCIELKGVEEW